MSISRPILDHISSTRFIHAVILIVAVIVIVESISLDYLCCKMAVIIAFLCNKAGCSCVVFADVIYLPSGRSIAIVGRCLSLDLVMAGAIAIFLNRSREGWVAHCFGWCVVVIFVNTFRMTAMVLLYSIGTSWIVAHDIAYWIMWCGGMLYILIRIASRRRGMPAPGHAPIGVSPPADSPPPSPK